MASAAIGIANSIVSTIFGGMAARAKEARNENLATQQAIQAYDQALVKIAQQYNSGNLSQSDAIAEANSIWDWFWHVTTPTIQPNRNGCASGGNCPHASTVNGEPANYCSGNIGATCCVGCGAIQLGISNVVAALQRGSGVADIPQIYGNKYGVQDRASYQITFTAPSALNPIADVGNTVNGLLGSLGLGGQSGAIAANTGIPQSTGISPTVLILGGFAAIALILIVRR